MRVEALRCGSFRPSPCPLPEREGGTISGRSRNVGTDGRVFPSDGSGLGGAGCDVRGDVRRHGLGPGHPRRGRSGRRRHERETRALRKAPRAHRPARNTGVLRLRLRLHGRGADRTPGRNGHRQSHPGAGAHRHRVRPRHGALAQRSLSGRDLGGMHQPDRQEARGRRPRHHPARTRRDLRRRGAPGGTAADVVAGSGGR